MKIKAILFIFLWFFPAVCFAQDLQPFSARVRLDISGDENLKNRVLSFVSHGLSSLGDVVLTDNKYKWIIEIVAIEVFTKGGSKVGVALSLAVLEVFDNTLILPYIPDVIQQFVSLYTPHFHKFIDHQLKVDSLEGLQRMCNNFVADFDSRVLKAEREDHQREIDFLKAYKDKKSK